jgi:hypothetical protein
VLDRLAVDLHRGLAGVLLDDREQVGEQRALEVVELGALDQRDGSCVLDRVDRAPLDGRVRRRQAPCLYAARAVALLRNLDPSS